MFGTTWLFQIEASGSLLILLTLLAGCGSKRDVATENDDPIQIVDEGLAAAPSNGFLGLTFDEINSTPLIVKSAIAGSPAERLGVMAGDEVVALEGTPNPGIRDIFDRLGTTTPGDELQVVLRRGAAEWELQIELISFDDVQGSMESQSKQFANE